MLVLEREHRAAGERRVGVLAVRVRLDVERDESPEADFADVVLQPQAERRARKDRRPDRPRLRDVRADALGTVEEQPAGLERVELAVEVVAPELERERVGERHFDPGLEHARAVVGIDVADGLQVADPAFGKTAAVDVLRREVQRQLAAAHEPCVV